MCRGIGEPWKVEDIEIDEPHAREVQVEMAYAGLCHSDEHLRTGDIAAPPEVLQLFGTDSMFPVVGGHEGAGVVTAVGPEVTQVAVGDRVTTAFIPSCGICFWCASGRQHLCDLGISTLAGPMISDGTWRYHLDGQNMNRMTQLGTFAETLVCSEASRGQDPRRLAAAGRRAHQLRHRHRVRLGRRPGQGQAGRGRGRRRPAAASDRAPSKGRAIAGARWIVAVDPLPFKVDRPRRSAPPTAPRRSPTRCPS